MKTLAEDMDQFTDAESDKRRWVQRARRRRGIRSSEGACWFVTIEQQHLETGNWDHTTEWLGTSPADSLSYAESMAWNARHRQGTGRWILETFEDGVNGPRYLVVEPRLDEDAP